MPYNFYFCSGASAKTVINCFVPRLPATSTKKTTDSPCGYPLFFRCGEDENSPFAYRAKSSSHSKRSREELAHLRRAIGIFSSAENPAIKLKPYASSPTARKHSLLFGGAYAPNDAIYRKRYALRKLLCPTAFIFARARQQKQLSTVLCLAYPPLRPKQK